MDHGTERMVLEQAIQQIRYIYHFDELTWIPGIISRPFYELRIDYSAREQFVRWLLDNCQGRIYVWAGCVTPPNGSHSWGDKIAPDEKTSFFIFDNDEDQTRFSLEFVGSADSMSAKIHKNGISARQHRIFGS